MSESFSLFEITQKSVPFTDATETEVLMIKPACFCLLTIARITPPSNLISLAIDRAERLPVIVNLDFSFIFKAVLSSINKRATKPPFLCSNYISSLKDLTFFYY